MRSIAVICLLLICLACSRQAAEDALSPPEPLLLSGEPWTATASVALDDSLLGAGNLQILSRDQGVIQGLRIGAENGYWSIRLPQPTQLGRHGRLRLRYRGSVDGSLRLGALVGREPDPRRLPLAHAVRAGVWEDLEFDLDAPGVADVAAGTWTLHAPADEIQAMSLSELRWQPADAGSPAYHQLDGVWRSAYSLAAGEALAWSLRGAGADELTLAVGPSATHAPPGSYRLRIAIRCDQGEHDTLWQRRLRSDDRRWHELRLALPECAASEHRLELRREDDPADRGFCLVARPRLKPKHRERPNVLLIVIDTLRADALARYGNPLPVDPRLESFLEGCVIFDQAYATASWTHPSVGSILSGELPHRHELGLAATGLSHFRPGIPLLAERLRDAGYATAAVSNNLIVSPREGLARGYDSFDQSSFSSSGSHGAMRVSQGAWNWLQASDGPWHLYLHYFDPHDRYQAPLPWTEEFSEVDASGLPEPIQRGRLHELIDRMFDEGVPTEEMPSPEELGHLRGLYDGEVGYADAWIGWLLERMTDAGMLDDTLVIVTADHGEEFLEHGALKHGHSLYEELLRIPLAIRFPDGRASETIHTPVSLLDLLPTILAAIGEEDRSLPGRDLARAPQSRPVFALAPAGIGVGDFPPHGTLQMIRDGRWKLIRQLDPARIELYDLDEDPFELRDLSAERDVSELLSRLDAVFGDLSDLRFEEDELDPEALEKLRALGYAQ